ncbi:MAG: FAD-binding protein [Bacteroidales bacterium]|nr:FAD-binding protein [Bacteroidales bacterium]MBN2820190.1 FAD-binding protein [Bacteroidales bacterium]
MFQQNNNTDKLNKLKLSLEGDLFTDNMLTTIYSTDASAYKEKPLAVAVPKTKDDILKLISFARENNTSIIPRTAGTSIAGQVVGNGLVVDVSKHFNKIIEINREEKWVRVQPGVVLDELNKEMEPYGLFFGPETSTSNRCMIGGMVGNNSCGAHSLIYGSTRDHTLEVKAILSDSTEVVFSELTKQEFNNKCTLNNLEGELYKHIYSLLSVEKVRDNILKEFPDPEIKRRNTGYAIDVLSEMNPFSRNGKNFNFCSLVAGSEGTLCFVTEIKLNLVPLPPKHKGLLVVHHDSIENAIRANVLALEFKPVAIELIDKFLLDCTKDSAEHKHNRFFIEGDPGALLCIEFAEKSMEEIESKSQELVEAFKEKGYGFHYPLLFGNDISKVWALRKAGLGLLSNIPGDAKPQPVIEDTAVSPKKLLDYIDDFNLVLKENDLTCVYYAHIATGELHLRPVINLKEEKGVKQFRLVATEIARLVKKYKGSLSGEHGDGRLRGEFIPFMIGEENYKHLIDLKKVWDPNGVFNKGKITNTPPMDTMLRFNPGIETPEFDTAFDFSDTLGYVRMAEKCNGSADCRKSSVIGGVMCPSYQATKDERNSTRARANMLREVLNNNNSKNRFDDSELYDVLDLCLSCKGCKTECPSGVDMAKLKSEFLYQYFKSHWIPIRTRLIASFTFIQSVGSKFALFYNYFIENKILSKYIKFIIGFAKDRSMPRVYRQTWEKWMKKNLDSLNNQIKNPVKAVIVFIDEFTNFNDVPVGIAAVKLLNQLGYQIKFLGFKESGRARISKGFLKDARKLAEFHVERIKNLVTEDAPLVGIEPSAILSFRDEYPDLLRGEMKTAANEIAKNVFTIEEFIYKEFNAGNISRDSFTEKEARILYHGHCQQKITSGTKSAKGILEIPKAYKVEEIKSGCCGMAGSFGYEKEHFELSMKIGEMVLFPAIRSKNSETIISASGTSCRHHIKDGTGAIAKHPVQILYESLKPEN